MQVRFGSCESVGRPCDEGKRKDGDDTVSKIIMVVEGWKAPSLVRRSRRDIHGTASNGQTDDHDDRISHRPACEDEPIHDPAALLTTGIEIVLFMIVKKEVPSTR